MMIQSKSKTHTGVTNEEKKRKLCFVWVCSLIEVTEILLGISLRKLEQHSLSSKEQLLKNCHHFEEGWVFQQKHNILIAVIKDGLI